MAEAFTYATQSIDRLLDEQPDRAAIILAKCYRTYKEVKDEIDSILQLSGPGKSQASRAPSNSAIPIPSHGSIRSHKRSPSSQLTSTPYHPRGTTKSNVAPTPPGSSSARSSKGSSASGETILLIDNHEDGIETLPVVLRKTATVEFSLIREDIVNERMIGAEPEEDRHFMIVLPEIIVSPGACAEIRISQSVLLTWRRQKSDSTHRTRFFLVPRHVLSTDVLLGYHDSGEGNPGSPDAGAGLHPHRQGYRDTDYRQEAQCPTVEPFSFHRSQNEPMAYQIQSLHQFNRHSMEGYKIHQAQPGLSEGNQQPMQPSPMPTSRNIRSTQEGRTKSTPPPIQTPSNDSERPNRSLRLSLKWGTTPINLSLDLDSSAEKFSIALKEASKHKQVHNWNSWVIWLKTEPQSPEDSAYRLTLGDDLDAYWDVTVDWLEQNKRDKPPHIWGLVQFEEGR
ncbi:hypothetical protein SVAN01_05173 [Stagonosporopsis vannaccii]|nr:hypothetical protein SVAN01_05173 [Stagonosporopsis vannaccii]